MDAVGAQGVTAFTPMVQVFRDGIPYHMTPRGSRFHELAKTGARGLSVKE